MPAVSIYFFVEVIKKQRDKGMGRWGDGEIGDGEMGRWEMGRWGDSGMAR